MSYFEICDVVVNEGWQLFHDPHKRMGPYVVSSELAKKTWVGYDDQAMVVFKSEYILCFYLKNLVEQLFGMLAWMDFATNAAVGAIRC